MEPQEFIHLLVEIRDLHREHLEEYRRVTREMLDIQRQSLARQDLWRRTYVRVVGILVIVAIVGVAMTVYFGLFVKH
jgi:hypothetical protein